MSPAAPMTDVPMEAERVRHEDVQKGSTPVEEPALSTLEQPEAPGFEPNRWLRWLYSRFFRHMRVDERWSGVVRESAASGVVVYVMRSISVLDFLCLDYLLKRFRLPLVRFVNDPRPLDPGALRPRRATLAPKAADPPGRGAGQGAPRPRERPAFPAPAALARRAPQGARARLRF